MSKDQYYEILGLKAGASEKEIVKAYKVLMKVLDLNKSPNHPDACLG